MSEPKEGDMQVRHFPQVPGDSFCVAVSGPEDAARIMKMLADYDIYQYEHQIKPDYCNATTFEVFMDGGWEDWYSDDGCDIDEWVEQRRESQVTQ